MALDKYVAEQRRFARLLGTDSNRSGLRVGSAIAERRDEATARDDRSAPVSSGD